MIVMRAFKYLLSPFVMLYAYYVSYMNMLGLGAIIAIVIHKLCTPTAIIAIMYLTLYE